MGDTAFYEEMQDVADELLAEFGQGSVAVVPAAASIADPNRPWDKTLTPGTPVPVDATVSKVDRKFINGTTIVENMDMVILPGATAVTEQDKLSVDGKLRKIVKVFPVPAAGVPAVLKAVLEN